MGSKPLVVAGAANFGPGFEYRFFDERVRTAAFGGVSVLLFDTAVETAPRLGFFLETTALGIRWPLTSGTALRLDPIGFQLSVPVLVGIPLVHYQFRHTLSFEFF